jgi:hypothetical protein
MRILTSILLVGVIAASLFRLSFYILNLWMGGFSLGQKTLPLHLHGFNLASKSGFRAESTYNAPQISDAYPKTPKPEKFKIDAVPQEIDPLHASLRAARRFLIGSVRLRTD